MVADSESDAPFRLSPKNFRSARFEFFVNIIILKFEKEIKSFV